jgi:hypothetical protein
MIDDERRKQLRVFLRVGMFAIATALAAVALIRFLAASRQIQSTLQQLEKAQNAGEDLRQKNNQLRAFVRVRDQHHAAAIRNKAFVGRYYHLCREPNDLPPLNTDFVVRDEHAYDQIPTAFAFSVPEGDHDIKIAIQKSVLGGLGGSTTYLTFPLLPSSGYFMRMHIEPEGKNEAGQLHVELTSNNADFKPIRQPLPIANALPQTLTPFGKSNKLNDIIEFLVQLKLMGNLHGRFDILSYPNSVHNFDQLRGVQEHGVELASSYGASFETPFTLRFSIISDSPECVSAQTAILFSGSRGRLRPYTGDGRFYIRPKN